MGDRVLPSGQGDSGSTAGAEKKGRSSEPFMRVYPLSSAVVLVAVNGEIDACNADQFGCYVRSFISQRPLVVDMVDATFVSAAGIRQLILLGKACTARGATWALTANSSITRLLRIVDLDEVLPLAGSMGEALRVVAPPS
jgi:anti-anti-sigma factor